MKRRVFLATGGGAVVALSATSLAGCSADNPEPSQVNDAAAEVVSRLREQYLGQFDADYVDNVIIPNYTVSIYEGQRSVLPMIDVALTKENALPSDLWGLLSKTWKPAPEEGVTVFLQGLEKRGPDNRRKRIYMSAVTPDLYATHYRDKIVRFWDELLSTPNAGKPLMRRYLDTFWDLYWDLHLGVRGEQIPAEVRKIGESFNTVLAFRDPTEKIVYNNYTTVRDNLDFLKSWIDDRLSDITDGRTAQREKTFAWYWLTNGENSEYFNHKDVVFECFHNFVAFSQWGNSLYNVMARLSEDSGDSAVKKSFAHTMAGNPDQPDGAAFPPLERFVMELFRTISPNSGSISALQENREPPFDRHGYIVSPHTSTSHDPVQWPNPDAFDPDRYRGVPSSQDINEARIRQMGLAACPFPPTSFEVKDGRKAVLSNSGFGTVFGVVDNRPLPVCDYAGFAPFGFGYRRCPGEQLTLMAFEDLLRKAWNDKLKFVKVDNPSSEKLPIGPNTVITDDIGFIR